MTDLEKAGKIILDMFKDDPVFNVTVFLNDYIHLQHLNFNNINIHDYIIESIYQSIPTPRSKKSLYEWQKIPFILDKRTRSIQTSIKLHPHTDEMIKIVFEHKSKSMYINDRCLTLLYQHNAPKPIYYSWT